MMITQQKLEILLDLKIPKIEEFLKGEITKQLNALRLDILEQFEPDNDQIDRKTVHQP